MLMVDNLVKSFDGAGGRNRSGSGAKVFAVDGVSFEVHDGELFTLLGPSGCGKTTTLRSVAGLERPDGGRIALSDRVLFDSAGNVNVPANQRRLGMVFQSYAIWPHLTVFKNVAFPMDVLPRRKRPSRKVIEERVFAVLEATELTAYAQRPATHLSGGQQQRLALARALLIQPELMLLDEPLSNLDAKLRESMRFELKRLQRELGLTSIYVTHDQAEALVISSRIAVMNNGRIEQIGKPRDIYMNPQTRFVAEFIGTSNFVEGTVLSTDGGEIAVDTVEGRLVVRGHDRHLDVGATVIASIRPECVAISTTPADAVPNQWSGQVVSRAFMGDCVDHIVSVGKLEIRNRSNSAQSLESGTGVHLTIDPANIVLIPLDEPQPA